MQTSPVEREFAMLDRSPVTDPRPGRPYVAFRTPEYAFPVPPGGYRLSTSLQEPRSRAEQEEPGQQWLDRACRVLNFAVALLALIACLPLMLLIAVAVRLSSSGPVLYVQERVGVDRRRPGSNLFWESRRTMDGGGRLFKMYKFRTMYVAERSSEEVWASRDDPRITPVGRLLRAYRLDELPQLVNVLKGDMNVVGPRPEQPRIFQELRQEIDRYPERQKVLPGITGWAQINHHYDQCLGDVERKLELDLEYIRRRSALEDLRIMARTMPVMVFRKGAI